MKIYLFIFSMSLSLIFSGYFRVSGPVGLSDPDGGADFIQREKLQRHHAGERVVSICHVHHK